MSVQEKESGLLETDTVHVRALAAGDLDAIVRIDAAAVGRKRSEFYRDRVAAALEKSRLHTSLVAELEGIVVGFLMTTNYYGEFGRPEPTAVIDSLGVLPGYRGKHVGEALMRQFLMNARGLRVERVRTEVRWNDFDILRFLARHGFAPTDQLVLERRLED
ncbi:MAG: GNAT family N-acetyltransferase [Myxococcales bacterium]|nr:GNAT family N-acetyltransferase [Myxococcales bacterium]